MQLVDSSTLQKHVECQSMVAVDEPKNKILDYYLDSFVSNLHFININK